MTFKLRLFNFVLASLTKVVENRLSELHVPESLVFFSSFFIKALTSLVLVVPCSLPLFSICLTPHHWCSLLNNNALFFFNPVSYNWGRNDLNYLWNSSANMLSSGFVALLTILHCNWKPEQWTMHRSCHTKLSHSMEMQLSCGGWLSVP